MCGPFQMHTCDCGPHSCGCGDFLTVDEEIRKMELVQMHLRLQLDLVGRRLESLKNAGK